MSWGMAAIPDRRAIVDRRNLNTAIAAIYQSGANDTDRRAQFLALLKTTLHDGKAEVRRRFDAGECDSLTTVRANAFLIDQVLRVIYDAAALREYPAATPTKADRLVMAAVGGYGRSEMAPASDIDLLFLYPYKPTPRGEQIAEYVLYMLWDLRLKVGHAVRSFDECIRLARQDLTIRTAVLEARYVWGDQALFSDLRRRFQDEVVANTKNLFVEAKLAERDARPRKPISPK